MDPGYTARYVEVEKSHWWFRARRQILRALLDEGVAWERVATLLEIGTGSGANLAELYPAGVELTGIEPEGASAELARKRGIATIHTGVLEDCPRLFARRAFDAITLFDVLEHVEDDRAALRTLRALLKPEGWLVLSVPAYQWLWSRHDVVNHHFRRYTRRGLVGRIREAGFQVHIATYFNTLLFPALALFRVLGRLRVRPGGGESTPASSGLDLPAGALNQFLYRVFAAERALVTRLSMPFGLSLFVLARRDPSPAPLPSSTAIPVLP